MSMRRRGVPEQMSLATQSQAEGNVVEAPDRALPLPSGKTDFVKIEKNLASLGFFTPSNKRIRGTTKKTVVTTHEAGGKRVEARATILPSAEYGLPITADQDTYLAILRIATEMQRRTGKVTNPIGFTTAEILRVQGKSCVSGYHYKELQEQLMRMKTATILSEGAVYFAGRRAWAKDAFNVIDRIVLFGTEMDDGTVADRHYVWLSDWQIENINSNYLLPIDYETYKQLRNHISKALVPLLQIWLYASREAGVFEKRYDELCQVLNVRQYQHPSKIREKLGPSLDELQAHGYLARWNVELTSDRSGYKVLLFHGEKFHRDRRRRLGTRMEGAAEPPAEPEPAPDGDLVGELVRRGVSAVRARKLLAELPEGQPVREQLAWGDELMARGGERRFHNPPGFYVHLLKENLSVPGRLKAAEATVAVAAEPVPASNDGERAEALQRFLETAQGAEAFEREVEAKKGELQRLYRSARMWSAATLRQYAEAAARAELGKRVG